MDITTIAKTAKITEKIISTFDEILEDKPTGLSRLLLAYGPNKIRNLIVTGRLKLQAIRQHQELFDETFKIMIDLRKKLIEESLKPSNNNLLIRIQLNQIEKELRLLETFKRSFQYIDKNQSTKNDKNPESDAIWWDMFEEMASRRNESWRVYLFARCIAENDKFPGAISLKALWEMAMMESSDFGALTIFCNSSLYIDGKPIIIMDPEDQYQYESDLSSFDTGNLALCVAVLINKNLVQKIVMQIMTTNPVELTCKSGTIFLHHKFEGLPENSASALRVECFAPTDHCLDICRLYEPVLNIVSDRNFEIFEEKLLGDMEQIKDGEPRSIIKFDKIIDPTNVEKSIY